jgi:hypothetical protein
MMNNTNADKMKSKELRKIIREAIAEVLAEGATEDAAAKAAKLNAINKELAALNAEKNAAAAAKANNEKRKDEEEFNRKKDGLKTAFNDVLFTMDIMALKYVSEDGTSVNARGKNIEGLLSGIVDMLRLIDSALADGGYAEVCARATAKKTAAAAAKVLTYFSKPNNALTTSSNNNNSRNKDSIIIK